LLAALPHGLLTAFTQKTGRAIGFGDANGLVLLALSDKICWAGDPPAPLHVDALAG
jgi:hypothetical protein